MALGIRSESYGYVENRINLMNNMLSRRANERLRKSGAFFELAPQSQQGRMEMITWLFDI